MSAPDTNTQKDARRHRGPLSGMLAVVLFALVLLAGLAFFLSGTGNTPEGTQSQQTGAGDAGAPSESVEGVADEAAPMQPAEQTTGADASVGEQTDTNPSESQVSTPIGEEPAPETSADD